MLPRHDAVQTSALDLNRLRRRGAELRREVVRRLASSLVLPADREDLLAISTGIDQMLRQIAAAGEEIASLGLDSTPAAPELASILTRCASQMPPVVEALEQHSGIVACREELTRLQEEARRVSSELANGLLKRQTDTSIILKWQIVCRSLNRAIESACEVGVIVHLAILKVARWVVA